MNQEAGCGRLVAEARNHERPSANRSGGRPSALDRQTRRRAIRLLGRLTGFDTVGSCVAALVRWSVGEAIPIVLVAVDPGALLGSINLLRSEMTSRPALTPWLAQLFVYPKHRRGGVGAALVRAALAHVERRSFSTLYLYTSGTLPQYYAWIGWTERERVEYLGKERTAMHYDITRPLDHASRARRTP